MCNKSYLEAFHFLQFFLHYKAKDIVQSKHIINLAKTNEQLIFRVAKVERT